MNRLIRCVISFVLPFFCLLVSVSYAEWTSDSSSAFTYSQSSYSSDIPNTTYSISDIHSGYTLSSSERQHLLDEMYSAGYYVLWAPFNDDFSVYRTFIFPISADIDLGVYSVGESSSKAYILPNFNSEYTYYYKTGTSNLKIAVKNSGYWKEAGSTLTYNGFSSFLSPDFVLGNFPYIKKLSSTSSSSYYWDGTSYYWERSEPEEPGEPTLPSNSEIAQAVQAFYNTIYNQPNIAFDDFFVLYDKSTNLYSYIGHTRGNAIGQVIVEPNGYYNGYKFDKQWWQFFLDEQNDSWEWQNITKYNNYYLYSSQGDIDTLKYIGKDTIDNLISGGPWATSNTIIVYATNDYPVKYITFSEDSPDPVVETGTIKGDQYTYDENLDITDNQYNPLENFVSVDYPSSLVSRAEFDKFMETFDENKDFLILPSDSNWIVIACNSLFNHFSSFVIMCAVFIIFERIMRG